MVEGAGVWWELSENKGCHPQTDSDQIDREKGRRDALHEII